MRKTYLDNIRFAVVLLVVIYHVCYIFNGCGVLGGIPDADSIALFDGFACIVYPWFMVLLFVISGMGARYSLQNRTIKQFLKERAVKLLVPSVLGLFVVHWITGYLNLKINGALAYIPPALVYPISVSSGIGPLWFIQLLFIFSLFISLFKKFDRSDRIWHLFERTNTPFILLLSLLIWITSHILNMPVITTYRFGIYFAAFLIGYYIFSHDEVQNKVEKICLPMTAAAFVLGVIYAVKYCGSNYASDACLQNLLTNLYLWAAVLAILGTGKRYFDKDSLFSRHMSENSFGIYVLHYPALITICFLLQYHTGLSALPKYITAFVLILPLTLAANAAVKRIPVIRFLVLGKAKVKNK